MYMIAKFIPQLNEWLPLPFLFTDAAAAKSHVDRLGNGHRVYFQPVTQPKIGY